MRFVVGDYVVPKAEWQGHWPVPTGYVKNIGSWGGRPDGVLYVGDDPRPFIADVFEKATPPDDAPP